MFIQKDGNPIYVFSGIVDLDKLLEERLDDPKDRFTFIRMIFKYYTDDINSQVNGKVMVVLSRDMVVNYIQQWVDSAIHSFKKVDGTVDLDIVSIYVDDLRRAIHISEAVKLMPYDWFYLSEYL